MKLRDVLAFQVNTAFLSSVKYKKPPPGGFLWYNRSAGTSTENSLGSVQEAPFGEFFVFDPISVEYSAKGGSTLKEVMDMHYLSHKMAVISLV